MLTALIFALTFAALGLLMFVERMGLPAPVAVTASYTVMGLAAVILALLNMTNRLGRFVIGHERGAILSSMALAATLLLTGYTLFLSTPNPLPKFGMVIVGWGIGLCLSSTRPWRNLRQPPADPGDRDPLAGGTGASMVAFFAILLLVATGALLVWDHSRSVWNDVLLGTDPNQMTGVALVSGALLFLGGMSALGRLALVAFSLAIFLALMPVLSEAMREVPMVAERLAQLSAGFPAAPVMSLTGLGSLPRPFIEAGLIGLAIGAASSQIFAVLPERHQRLKSGVLAMLLASLLASLMLFANQYLSDSVQIALQRLPPTQWPAFVFDPALRGWLVACGVAPEDPLAAALACGAGSPRAVLPVNALLFNQDIAWPALAVSLGWPVLIGNVWIILPAWLSLIGFLTLVQVLATGLAERIVFRLLRPKALRSARLAYGRMIVLAIALALAAFGSKITPLPANAMLWVMLGAALLLAVASVIRLAEALLRLSRRPAAQVGASDPALIEAS